MKNKGAYEKNRLKILTINSSIITIFCKHIRSKKEFQLMKAFVEYYVTETRL